MSTVTLPMIVSRISESGQFTLEIANSIFSVLTETASEIMKADGNITIPHIGSLRVINLVDSTLIEFAPDQTLAAVLNTPFSMFSPVDLPADITEADIDKDIDLEFKNDENKTEPKVEKIECQSINTPIPPPIPQRRPPVVRNNEPDQVSEQSASINQTFDSSESNLIENKVPQTTQSIEKIVDKERIVEVRVRPPHYVLYTVLIALLTLTVGIVVGYIMCGHVDFRKVNSVNIETKGVNLYHIDSVDTTIVEPKINPVEVDSVKTIGQNDSIASSELVKSNNSDEKIIYDTVRADRFLTTIALDHYGKKKFWVYIYKENQSIISDPDNIAPNTVVIVPPSDKYGIKPGDKQSEADAERLAEEIFGKYQ